MAANNLSNNPAELLKTAVKAAEGLKLKASELDIKDITEAQMLAAIVRYNQARSDFKVSRSDLAKLGGQVTAADLKIQAWLAKARPILVAHLGARWSTAWIATGFPHTSTAVPDSIAERWDLCGSLEDFFIANPGMEVTNPALGDKNIDVTDTKAAALHEEMRLAIVAEGGGEEGKDEDKGEVGAAKTGLRRLLRGLINLLALRLSDSDERWRTFGFNPPGAPERPEQVANLAAETLAPGRYRLTCDASPRADRYRWFAKAPGAADFIFLERSDDPQIILENQPIGTEIQAIAANAAGESTPSPALLLG